MQWWVPVQYEVLGARIKVTLTFDADDVFAAEREAERRVRSVYADQGLLPGEYQVGSPRDVDPNHQDDE